MWFQGQGEKGKEGRAGPHTAPAPGPGQNRTGAGAAQRSATATVLFSGVSSLNCRPIYRYKAAWNCFVHML